MILLYNYNYSIDICDNNRNKWIKYEKHFMGRKIFFEMKSIYINSYHLRHIDYSIGETFF